MTIDTYQEQIHPESLKQKTSRETNYLKQKCLVREYATKPTVVSGSLDSLGAGEETAIDGVNNRLCGNPLAAEETAIKALDRIFAALNAVELQVNVALRVRIYRDVNNMAIFLFAFLADVVF